MARDYSSIYSIKNMAIKDIAPKYFNMTEVNDLNVGLLGYITELVGTVTEDNFNTVTTYMNEMFPHLAVLPESIYNHAGLFQIDGTFAIPSETTIYLFISERDIMENAKPVKSTTSTSFYEFFIDSDMIIDFGGVMFKPDYDIRIRYRTDGSKTIFDANYVTESHGAENYVNTISNIKNNIYIKSKQINYENTKYLQIEVKAHQVTKFTKDNNIVLSDVINLPTYDIEFDDYLANFEIFYKAPNSSSFVQMKKQLSGSIPSKDPFCYYSLVDENTLRINFTTRDNYFKPEYNSEIIIDYYTTTGSAGNFEAYMGTDINITTSSEKYDYNKNIVIFALPVTSAVGGVDPLTLEQLKNKAVAYYSTTGSYTTESDLQIFFDGIRDTLNSNIKFLKKRDDLVDRVFSSFTIFKNKYDDIYKSNTVNIELSPEEFDSEYEQSDLYKLEPGHLFLYSGDSLDTVEMVENSKNIKGYLESGVSIDEYINKVDENGDTVINEFIYTNPFLIYFSKDPLTISYYINTVNDKYSLDLKSNEDSSFVQFTTGTIGVYRNGIIGENRYRFTISIMPTSEMPKSAIEILADGIDEDTMKTLYGNNSEIFIKNNIRYANTNRIKLSLSLLNDSGSPVITSPMSLVDYDMPNDIYTFSTEIETDDYITIDNNLRMYKGSDSQLVSMEACVAEINMFYNDGDDNNTDSGYVKTNTYTTESTPIELIKAAHMIMSDGDYINTSDGDNYSYEIGIKSSPLLKYDILSNTDTIFEFIEKFNLEYYYLNTITDKVTNNFSIDMKMYNTYGRSKNFYIDNIGDDGISESLLDKVNIGIEFKIHPLYGVDEADLIRDVKSFIKNYIETINISGSNTIHISNLIKELENNFSSIDFIRFKGINNYGPLIQSIENKTTDLSTLSKEERKSYVPEYLTIDEDNINIIII